MPQFTRREFVTSVSALALLAASAESAQPTAVPILDTHTHFYDPTRLGGVPWPSKVDTVLYGPVLPEHFVALTKSLGSGRHAPGPRRAGRTAGAGRTGIQRESRAVRETPQFYGIRIGHSLLKARLDDSRFLANLDRLGEKSLVLDVNGGPELLPDVARLAEKVPDLQIVVNHLANVAIDGNAPPEAWRKGMLAAGKHKHVACKVSAYVEGAARGGKKAPVDAAFYKPVFDVAWDAFGEERLMFGSNWPVSERAAEYKTLLAIAQADVAGRKAGAASFSRGTRGRFTTCRTARCNHHDWLDEP
jgi:L-fuconolactonase